MRFLVDMPLSPGIASWLADRGHDAVHAPDVGLGRAPNEAIPAQARDEQRVVITADLDYPQLLALTRAEGPGLILFRGGNHSEHEAVDRLGVAMELVPEAELPTSVVVIQKSRIRRRKLPLEPGS